MMMLNRSDAARGDLLIFFLPGVAAEAVDIAFQKCYADTAPFDRAP